MKRLALMLCLFGIPLFAQHHLGPAPESIGAGQGGVRTDTFPPGAIHVWKMEQATGTTRSDYVGTAHMTQAGTGDITQAAGMSGFGAVSAGGAGGPYLAGGQFMVTGDFTVSVWASSSAATFWAIGPQGGTPTITTATDGTVTVSLWDPVTGSDSSASGDCGTPETWVLLVARFNQVAKTFNVRCYGYGGVAQQFESAAGSGPWLNAITFLALAPFYATAGTTTAGTVDEVVVFNRYLTDAEADRLQTVFYVP